MRDGRDLRFVDVGRIEVLRGAEIGVHGALAVRRHQDVAAAGGGAAFGRLGLEGDAGGADIVGVEGADLVGLDLADEGGAGAETGDADDGVGAGAAAHLGRRAHILVDRGGAGLVDQRHAALGHAVAGEKALIGLHQHVENRIADPENVVFCVSHSSVLFHGVCAKKPRAARKAAAYQIGPAPAREAVPSPRHARRSRWRSRVAASRRMTAADPGLHPSRRAARAPQDDGNCCQQAGLLLYSPQ